MHRTKFLLFPFFSHDNYSTYLINRSPQFPVNPGIQIFTKKILLHSLQLGRANVYATFTTQPLSSALIKKIFFCKM